MNPHAAFPHVLLSTVILLPLHLRSLLSQQNFCCLFQHLQLVATNSWKKETFSSKRHNRLVMSDLPKFPKYHTLSHIKEEVVSSQLQVFMVIINLKPYLKFRTSNFRWHDLKTACSQQQLIVYLNTSCCFLLCAACTVNTMEMSMLNFDLCLLQQCISMTRSSTLWSCWAVPTWVSVCFCDRD